MKNGAIILIVGVILLIAAVGIFAYSVSSVETMAKQVNLGVNETKSFEYELQEGKCLLVLSVNGSVSYELKDPSGNQVIAGNLTDDTLTENITVSQGKYTFSLTNIGDESASATIIFEQESGLMRLSSIILSSGAVCLVGVILIIVGIVISLKEKG